MLIAFLISLFFGGEPDQFIVPKIERYCNRHLDDSTNIILKAEIDEYKKASKRISKANRKNTKKFRKKRLEYALKEHQFDDFLSKYINQFEYMDSLSMKSRKIFKKELTQDQWNEALLNIDKQITKHKKHYTDKRNKLLKRINKLKNKTRKSIDRKGMNPATLVVIEGFEQHLLRTLDEYETSYFGLINYLKDYESGEASIITRRNEINQIRHGFYNHFKKTYFDLSTILSDDEWKMIQRQFNSIL